MRSVLGPMALVALTGCGSAPSSSNIFGGSDTGGTGGSSGSQDPSNSNSNGSSNGGGSSSGGNASSSGSSGSGVNSGFGSSSGSGSSGGSASSSSGGGSSSSSSSGGGGGTSSGTVTTTGSAPTIPAVSGTCPTLTTGTITVSGQSVSIWAGTKGSTPAPVLFYWHGTGSTADEAEIFMSTQIAEITGEGGLVASFSTSTGTGTDTGDGVWYTGDFAMADQILACAVQQLNIDTRMIYTAGCSAGGLQSGAMLFARSAYLAAAMPNSGGEVIAGEFPLENAHVPSLITTHGGSSDDVVISFATASATLDMDVAGKAASSSPPGGYVVDCNHGGGHCGAPAADIAAQWQFCKDHPFGVSPDPYASGLPSTFPSYCTIIK